MLARTSRLRPYPGSSSIACTSSPRAAIGSPCTISHSARRVRSRPRRCSGAAAIALLHLVERLARDHRRASSIRRASPADRANTAPRSQPVASPRAPRHAGRAAQRLRQQVACLEERPRHGARGFEVTRRARRIADREQHLAMQQIREPVVEPSRVLRDQCARFRVGAMTHERGHQRHEDRRGIGDRRERCACPLERRADIALAQEPRECLELGARIRRPHDRRCRSRRGCGTARPPRRGPAPPVRRRRRDGPAAPRTHRRAPPRRTPARSTRTPRLTAATTAALGCSKSTSA